MQICSQINSLTQPPYAPTGAAILDLTENSTRKGSLAIDSGDSETWSRAALNDDGPRILPIYLGPVRWLVLVLV